jgi:hypothetical protein
MIIPLEGGGGPVRFQWNPERINGPSASPNWVPIRVYGRELPYYQYTTGGTSAIQFVIQLSAGDAGPAFVKGIIERLHRLTKPMPGMGGAKHPPRVIVILGAALREMCVLREVRPERHGVADPGTLQHHEANVSLTFWRVQ